MIVALLLILVGVILIVSNPILGLIPGILLIIIGIVAGILAGLGRGIGALAGIGSTMTCPDCRSNLIRRDRLPLLRVPVSMTIGWNCPQATRA